MKDLLEPGDNSLRDDNRGQISLLTIAAYAKYQDRSTSEIVEDAQERYDNLKEEYF